MSDEDPFRYCAYCRADCYADDPEHAPGCPSSTGVFVVREEDCGPECPHCGERMHGPPRCMDCGETISVGQNYTHRVVEEGNPLLSGIEGAEVRELICVGCAAREALL